MTPIMFWTMIVIIGTGLVMAFVMSRKESPGALEGTQEGQDELSKYAFKVASERSLERDAALENEEQGRQAREQMRDEEIAAGKHTRVYQEPKKRGRKPKVAAS